MTELFIVLEYEACNPEARECTDWRMCRAHYYAASEAARSESLPNEKEVTMGISVGCMVRREGRPELGVGNVAELFVGELAGQTARVNWPAAGYATVVDVQDLRRDPDAEAERGNRWLSDG